jgi:biopolymer transport protein ExbB/TolQ
VQQRHCIDKREWNRLITIKKLKAYLLLRRTKKLQNQIEGSHKIINKLLSEHRSSEKATVPLERQKEASEDFLKPRHAAKKNQGKAIKTTKKQVSMSMKTTLPTIRCP